MRFQFTGECLMNGEETKNPFIRKGVTTKDKIPYQAFNCGIKAAKNNAAWGIEMFAMDNDTIKTQDVDGNNIEIDAGDCFDEDIIKNVANYKKNIINIKENERREFINPYDAISYLVENVDDIKNKKITITGQVTKDFYNGNTRDRFQIQNVYSVADDIKCGLKCTDIFYFDKDSFDTADWSSEHKLNINGWVSTFINKDLIGAEKGKNMYVPHTVVFDCSKIDWENEKHVKMVNLRLKMLGCELVNGKIKCNLKKNVYSMSIVMSYNNGAEQEEFTEDMLTDAQREFIELGIKTIDDFKSNVYGQRVTVYKLIDFDLKGDYSDGFVDMEMTPAEFEENVFTPNEEEKLSEVMSRESDSSISDGENDDDDDDMDEDLFS